MERVGATFFVFKSDTDKQNDPDKIKFLISNENYFIDSIGWWERVDVKMSQNPQMLTLDEFQRCYPNFTFENMYILNQEQPYSSQVCEYLFICAIVVYLLISKLF